MRQESKSGGVDLVSSWNGNDFGHKCRHEDDIFSTKGIMYKQISLFVRLILGTLLKSGRRVYRIVRK
jgi:hypothetical protein